jgi:hypothetical protein
MQGFGALGDVDGRGGNYGHVKYKINRRSEGYFWQSRIDSKNWKFFHTE